MVIETERMILRPMEPRDAEDIFAYCQNPEVGSNAGWKPHVSLEETKEIMQEVFLNRENVFGIVLKENGKMIGSIGLIPDPKRQYDKILMLGYALGKEYWGRGLMTGAAKAVIDYGFENLGLEAVSAYCFSFNDRSRRIFVKCGFEYEGTLKKSELRYDGLLLDEECWLLVR